MANHIKYTDETPMPFGKYKGAALINVPASYLVWLYDNGYVKNLSLKDYIEDNMELLRKEAINKPSMPKF